MTLEEKKAARSEYFRKINAMRKNPFTPFKDSEKARSAQKLSVESRKAKS